MTVPTPLASTACQHDAKHKFSHLRLLRLPRTTFKKGKLPGPPVRMTTNTNFGISACHGYPERSLHTTSCQHRLSGRHQTLIFASPLTTATPKNVYTQQLASRQLLQKAVCTAPAARKPAAGHAGQPATTRSSSSCRLCVLRLPHECQPPARRRPCAPQLLQQALCTAPATRTLAVGASRGPGGDHAHSMYCACHTRASHAKASRGPTAPTRATDPPGGSVYCACQTTAWCD